MNKREKIDYSIGLDIGTTSVGWAVTDINDNIIKFNGKNMLGARLFEIAETAIKRRTQRGIRRLIVRRKKRLDTLYMLLEEEISKVDVNFSQKLKESFLVKEDKTIEGFDMVFKNDFPNYYKDYKTIYHLRKKLVESTEKQDIRLIYLALHHILKHRGHFLYEGLEYKKEVAANDIKETIEEVIYELNELNGVEGLSNNAIAVEAEGILKILVDKNLNRSRQKEELKKLIGTKENKGQTDNFIKAVFDDKANFNKLLMLEEKTDKIEISFSSEKAEDEAMEKIPNNMNIFTLLQKIYNYIVLQKNLGEEIYLSYAMVNKYEKHGEDLKALKEMYKKYVPERIVEGVSSEEYKNMFKRLASAKSGVIINYTSVKGKTSINYSKKKGEIIKNYANYNERASLTTREELYARIKAELKIKEDIICADKNGNKLYNYIVKSIDNEDFLLRQSSKENVATPMQLHKREMIEIIRNQAKYYDVLKDNEEKLLKLLEFCIPYYVGPLNNNGQGIAWAKRKIEGVKIYPWNFDEIIDKEAASDDFIKRMTNKCTYLGEENVLPKNSLLYSEYEVLNELNKIKVNGELIADNKIKLRIIDEVFRKKKNVKIEALKKWMIDNYIPIKSVVYKHTKDIVIEGMQKEDEFASSLISYIDFTNIFGEINISNEEAIEEIIYWVSIIKDKEMVSTKIKNKYPILDINKIEKILKLRYSGWGRLSKRLLNGMAIVDKNNNSVTVINQLRRTNMNFIQIINDKELGFDKEIEKITGMEARDKISYAPDISGLQGSPAIKRGIWQTLQIVEEIVKIMKHAPKNIYIEFAREEQKQATRTASRIDKMMNIYVKMEKEDDYKDCYKELKVKKKEDNKLSSEMMFLYFIQNGKSMYSGKLLDINYLSSTCEVDHIIPRAYIKDDSIENKALVLKDENQSKMDNIVLPEGIRLEQRLMWESLLKTGLIGAKKYKSLTRASFVEDDFKGLINRQLVETRQIAKRVVELLEAVYFETSIITIRANLISNFRQQFDLYKSRSINDYHHAHDAYLTTVIGHYILGRYPNLRREIEYGSFMRIEKGKDHVKQKGFGFIISSMNNDYTSKVNDFIWNKNIKMEQVRKVLNYKDCCITKKLEENSGEFYDQTLYATEDNAIKRGTSKGVKKTENLLPKNKNLDVSKYGGYSSENAAYWAAIEYIKDSKTVKELVPVAIQAVGAIKQEEDLVQYLKVKIDCDNIKILRSKILKFQLIEFDGDLLYITGNSDKQNAKQFFIKEDYKELFYKVENDDKDITEEHIYEFYNYYIDKVNKYYPILQGEINKLLKVGNEIEKLNLEEKIKFVKELVKLTQVNSTNPNFETFKTLNLKPRMGRIIKKINLDKTEFIDQSITGLYEVRTRL